MASADKVAGRVEILRTPLGASDSKGTGGEVNPLGFHDDWGTQGDMVSQAHYANLTAQGTAVGGEVDASPGFASDLVGARYNTVQPGRLGAGAPVSNVGGEAEQGEVGGPAVGYHAMASRPRGVFMIKHMTDARDFMSDDMLAMTRGGMRVDEMLRAGQRPYLRWPFPDSIVNHHQLVDFFMDFTCCERNLSGLLNESRSGHAPLVLPVDSAALFSKFGTMMQMAQNSGYDFVPHSITCTSLMNRHVPCTFLGQFFTCADGARTVAWLQTNRICCSNGSSVHGMLGSGNVALRMLPGQETPEMKKVMFLGDSGLLNEAQWCRWAALDKDDVRRALNSSRHACSGNQLYKFVLPNANALTAPDPVCHAVLKNLPDILQRAQSLPQFREFGLEQAVVSQSDGTVCVYAPKVIVDEMLRTAFSTVNHERNLMRLSNCYMELRPEDSWDNMRERMEQMRRTAPAHVWNPDIYVSATLHFVGVLIRRPAAESYM